MRVSQLKGAIILFALSIMAQMKAAFSRQTAEQAEIIRRVASWRDAIDSSSSAPVLNILLSQVQAMPDGAIKIQVSAILDARREALHLTYDRDLCRFIGAGHYISEAT